MTYEVKVCVVHTMGERSIGDITDRSCNSITIGSPGSPNSNHWKVEYYLTDDSEISDIELGEHTRKMKNKEEKPPYRVPLMQEIERIPWNGYKVISTFSGCGGSTLGYRLAGCRVLWANEFIPAAQETYKANNPHSILDTRDIRKVQTEEILKSIGLQRGEIDIFDGSPPCSSFSTAGKRESGWGKSKDYSDTKQRTDDLFFEYTRLVKGLQPKVFVAENVSGLVKGTAKGYFLEILKALKGCGYMVIAKLLDAQWLGVPQMRQRIIFIGVRNDLVETYKVKPAHPSPLPYSYTVRDALPWIVKHGAGKGFGNAHYQDSSLGPAGTIGAGPSSGHGLSPAGTVYAPAGESPLVSLHAVHDTSGLFSTGDITDRPSPTLTTSQHWFIEEHVIEPQSNMSQYAVGVLWDELRPGESHSRRFNLSRPSLERPCPTVTGTGGNASAASVTHPTEKRKFSIEELKRICAFPDDFILTGTYAQQWERLGRAVPPVMMKMIAQTICKEILDRCK